MIELRSPKIAIPVVLFAGLLWSFGPLVVRYMDNPQLVPWQYIFGRGLTIFILLNLYLFFEEGKNFYKNYFKIGLSGIVGGAGLGVAMITFIYSITNTSAAVTLLCLAAMPFFTALLAFMFLKEKISLNVWISIILATAGIFIMALGNTSEKSLIGFVFGLTASIGFSVFSVSLRWRKETPKFTTVAFAGLFCVIFSFRNKKPNKAVMNGIDARQRRVTAAEVLLIDQIKEIIAIAKPVPPNKPEIPIFI